MTGPDVLSENKGNEVPGAPETHLTFILKFNRRLVETIILYYMLM